MNTETKFATLFIALVTVPVFRNGTPILAILRDNVQQLRHLGFLIGV